MNGQNKMDGKLRVQIKFEVQKGGARVEKALPFVVGVMGNFAGMSSNRKPLRQRAFEEIDDLRFDQIMGEIKPFLGFSVKNTLTKNGTNLPVELTFQSIEDFEPENVIRQIESLRKRLEKRQRLSELLAKMDGNKRFSMRLEEIVQDEDLFRQLHFEVGQSADIDHDDPMEQEGFNE